MAQTLKLKRTAVSGKIPTTSNLELGELAMNTYDGRIFFEKDSGIPAVSEILTTNTENYITGSLTLSGSITITDSITASSFVGDGSQLTNVVADVSQVATVTSSFDNQSTISVAHNFDSKNIIVSVYGTDNSQIIPQSVTLTDNNTTTVVLSSNESGYIVIAKGGHIVSGSASDASALNGQIGSFYLDYTNFTNIPSGIISGSSQITNLTSYREDVSGNSTYTITHNLSEDYPIVQAYNTSTKKQEQPQDIESLDSSSLQITFSSNFTGKIVIKK